MMLTLRLSLCLQKIWNMTLEWWKRRVNDRYNLNMGSTALLAIFCIENLPRNAFRQNGTAAFSYWHRKNILCITRGNMIPQRCVINFLFCFLRQKFIFCSAFCGRNSFSVPLSAAEIHFLFCFLRQKCIFCSCRTLRSAAEFYPLLMRNTLYFRTILRRKISFPQHFFRRGKIKTRFVSGHPSRY